VEPKTGPEERGTPQSGRSYTKTPSKPEEGRPVPGRRRRAAPGCRPSRSRSGGRHRDGPASDRRPRLKDETLFDGSRVGAWRKRFEEQDRKDGDEAKANARDSGVRSS
jgi:hypothetical protein